MIWGYWLWDYSLLSVLPTPHALIILPTIIINHHHHRYDHDHHHHQDRCDHEESSGSWVVVGWSAAGHPNAAGPELRNSLVQCSFNYRPLGFRALGLGLGV